VGVKKREEIHILYWVQLLLSHLDGYDTTIGHDSFRDLVFVRSLEGSPLGTHITTFLTPIAST
jgi:hypothetical protein